MKYMIFSFGLLLFLGCNSQNSTKENEMEAKTEKLVDLADDSSKAMTNVAQIDTLNKWTILKNDTIRIRTKNQKVDFVSKPKLEEDISSYTYKGFNKSNQYHTVCGQYWETYRCYLIDQETSRIDTIWTEPIFSPDSRYLISKSMDYGLEGIPNGFQVWHLDNNRNWIKTNEIDQQEWIPIEINWLSSDSIEIKTVTIDHYNEVNWEKDKLMEFKKIKMKIK